MYTYLFRIEEVGSHYHVKILAESMDKAWRQLITQIGRTTGFGKVWSITEVGA